MSNKHLIIGTAGHIDHGKTTLVKALTNIDCDRLKEEKERGITIELGFAYFDLPSGRRAGIVDVPGHERFIKNMLAGAGGMDLVMLVVSADEGVMPQTVEHLHILSLLQLQKGLVVVTKADLVDQDWLDLVIEDISDRLKGTFLEHSPIVPVSAVTGAGIATLAEVMDELIDHVAGKSSTLPFRLPIDRVFTVQGFGTVVTGTLCAGEVKVGDVVEIMPSQLSARVRGVGVHSKKVDKAEAGQRTALNLAGISVEQVSRGDMLCAPGVLSPSMMLDVRLSLIEDAERALNNRERVRLYVGTSEVLGRVVLLDAEVLLPGDTAFAQLRLEEPVALWAGDRFVLRSYSPMVTIGGGAVLDPRPIKRKRFREQGLSELRVLESGSTAAVLDQYLRKNSDQALTQSQLLSLVSRPGPELEEALEELLSLEQAVSLRADDSSYLFHREFVRDLAQKLEETVAAYHKRFPLRSGMPREELRSRLFPKANTRIFGALLFQINSEVEVPVVVGPRLVSLAGFTVSFEGKWLRPKEELMLQFLEQPFTPPTLDVAHDEVKLSPDELKELFESLVEQGELVKVSENIFFHRTALCEAINRIDAHFSKSEEMTLAEFRTSLDSSRKFALPLLEYLDQKRFTLRTGEGRRLNKSFDRSTLPC